MRNHLFKIIVKSLKKKKKVVWFISTRAIILQEKLEQVSDFNEWYPVGWIGDICYLYNNEVAFLNFRNSIVDLESHEVMFVDRSGEGCVGFYQMYTLDELIEKGKLKNIYEKDFLI